MDRATAIATLKQAQLDAFDHIARVVNPENPGVPPLALCTQRIELVIKYLESLTCPHTSPSTPANS